MLERTVSHNSEAAEDKKLNNLLAEFNSGILAKLKEIEQSPDSPAKKFAQMVEPFEQLKQTLEKLKQGVPQHRFADAVTQISGLANYYQSLLETYHEQIKNSQEL
ncbi:MAG: hypothetical protein KGJ93_03850 [Patescibacteria group bacterium]|nr:hypothetical protein [Patescibacteria group bacterium]